MLRQELQLPRPALPGVLEPREQEWLGGRLDQLAKLLDTEEVDQQVGGQAAGQH